MSIQVTPIPRLTTLTTPAFTLGTANTAGTAITAVASDATLLAFDTTVPAAVAAAAATGSATVAARRDHVHNPFTNFVTVVKESNQSVNDSTTLVNDSALLFAVAANEDWTFMAYLCTEEDGSASADFKTLFTGPSGSSLTYAQIAPKTTISDMGNVSDLSMAGTKTGASFKSGNVNDTGTELATRVWWGSIINGETAGNLQLQWAQATAVGVDTILLAGSYIVGWQA